MPEHNAFQHQRYPADSPRGAFALLHPDPPPAVGSPAWTAVLQRAAARTAAAGVERIVLLHGTFVGTDALGLIRKLARVWPAAAGDLRRLQKHWLDRLTGDHGNYTEQFAEYLRAACNEAAPHPVVVERFHWSSENHHIGRADGAVRLADHLLGLPPSEPGRRVMLWGHSHGGNVLALLTNLLAADPVLRGRFFRACRPYYRIPWLGQVDCGGWTRARRRLMDQPRQFAQCLDLVTFGTPVRYGWDTLGCGRLLHFIHHKPRASEEPFRAALPERLEDLFHVRDGDYIQHFGIAGTNVNPALLGAFRARLAERRLNRLLQVGLRRRDFLARFRRGVRVHEDGLSLLVDYGPPTGHLELDMLGHAVYTTCQWLPFHLQEIAHRFYGAGSAPAV